MSQPGYGALKHTLRADHRRVCILRTLPDGAE
jgi:hypothetical protein